MKTLYYSIITTLIFVFFFTFYMGNSYDAHATCVTINGTEECSTPPPILTSIQSYYTPNETIHLVGFSRPNSMIQVDLVDPNNNVKNSVLFQSDSSGRFQNQFVVPDDAVNGTWKINISSGITHSTRYITVISKNLQDNQTTQNENQPTIGFDNASYSTKKMTCDFYNTGKISAQDNKQTKVIITVTDPNANKFSTSIDRVTIYVWSDSDQKGVEITAYETEVNSGIFKGTITISDGQSTQDAIHVSEGDTLSARYPSTTPLSVNTANHGIVTTAFIGISCPPFERVPASSIRILDDKGNGHNVIAVDQQVMITSDIVNPTPTNQNFTYIVQIQDKNGSTASLAWLTGTMLSKQAFSPSVSWTPSRVGNYVVNVFVWQSLTNPNALSAPLYTDLTVLHSSSMYGKSIIGNVENLHCKLGFELVIKPSNNSPACVTPSTVTKLVERGWAVDDSSHSTEVEPFDTLKMNVLGTDFSFNYTILGGQLENATANMQNKSLDLSLKTTENGTLFVILPRGLIDPKYMGKIASSLF